MNVRQGWRLVFTVLALSFFLCPIGAQAQGKPVIMNLGFIPYGNNAFFYVGLDKGWYREEGLDVKIVRGFGSADAYKKVDSGRETFGGSDSVAVVVGRAKGGSSKMVSLWLERPPHIVTTLEGSGIKALRDLEGKKLGAAIGDATIVLLPEFLAGIGADYAKITAINTDFATRDAALIAGAFDASTTFVTGVPSLERIAQKQGKRLHYFLLSDYGLDIVGYGIVANEKVVKEEPQVVRGFLKGALKGAAYAIQHPDEAIDILLKYAPMLDRATNREVLDITFDLMLSPTVLEKGLGYMEESRWVRTLNFVPKVFKLERKPKPEEVYSNDFLPGIRPPVRAERKYPKKI